MSSSNAPETFRVRLAKVHAKLTPIAKQGTNEKLRYNFANESDIKEAVRPILAEHDLFLSSTALIDQVEFAEITRTSGSKAYAARVPVRVTIHDGLSDQSLSSESIGFAIDNDDKPFSKAQQAGIKYGMIALLDLSVGEREADHDSPNTEAANGHAPANGAAPQTNGATNGHTAAPADRPETQWSKPRGVALLTDPQRNLIEKEAKRTCITPDGFRQLCINVSGGHAQGMDTLSKQSASKVIEYLKGRADGEFEEVTF